MVQLSEFKLYYQDDSEIAISSVSNPGGDNPSNEGPSMAIDGSIADQVLTLNEGDFVTSLAFPADLRLSACRSPWGHVRLGDGNDEPGRDPMRWTLLASSDYVTWNTLDFSYASSAFLGLRLLATHGRGRSRCPAHRLRCSRQCRRHQPTTAPTAFDCQIQVWSAGNTYDNYAYVHVNGVQSNHASRGLNLFEIRPRHLHVRACPPNTSSSLTLIVSRRVADTQGFDTHGYSSQAGRARDVRPRACRAVHLLQLRS